MSIRGRPRAFTQSEEADVVRLYLDGWSGYDLARKYKCHYRTVLGTLQRQNCPRRPVKRYALDWKVFLPPLSPEAKYWIGFLMADGCVSKRSEVTLELKGSDEEHVRKFRAFIKSDAPIKETSQRCARIAIRSIDLALVLADYGIVPRKSLIACAPAALLYSRDFWRGMIDGDGCISPTRSDPRVSLVGGGEAILHQWASFVEAYCAHRPAVRQERKQLFRAGTYRTDTVRKLLCLLYHGAPPIARLERKFLLACEFMG
jgi:hypothetical protein